MNTFCVSQLTTNLLNSLKQILLLRLKNEANTFLSQLSILFEGLKILRTGFLCQIFWRAFLTFFFFFFLFLFLWTMRASHRQRNEKFPTEKLTDRSGIAFAPSLSFYFCRQLFILASTVFASSSTSSSSSSSL